jgi:hypothetical protein
MCCLFTTLLLFGPRLGIIVWGLLQPARWDATFVSFVWPLLGFVFLPWTTIMYVAVYPLGVTGLDWLWLGLALVVDIATWAGGAYRNRGRIQSAYQTT